MLAGFQVDTLWNRSVSETAERSLVLITHLETNAPTPLCARVTPAVARSSQFANSVNVPSFLSKAPSPPGMPDIVCLPPRYGLTVQVVSFVPAVKIDFVTTPDAAGTLSRCVKKNETRGECAHDDDEQRSHPETERHETYDRLTGRIPSAFPNRNISILISDFMRRGNGFKLQNTYLL